APYMPISGLEDEYRLSTGKPQLIYIKNPAPDREPPLKDLLARIKKADAISYKYFATAEELGELIANDLALLLTERFELSDAPGQAPPGVPASPTHNLPAPVTPFIGRHTQVEELSELLSREDVRLVSLTGPGGAGKTRLSLQVATNHLADFPDGVYFVSLDNIADASLVLSKTAQTLGVREGGSQPLRENLITYLRDKHLLLLLDNFEQVTEAAPILVEWLEAAPALHILVTSRALLNLRGEHEYEVPPLTLAPAGDQASMDQVQESEAFQLFLERARSANPRFEPTPENTAAIVEICRRLDGLPLAIELAAARIKLFSPEVLLEKLGASLDVLTGGARDLPARQQTLRDAIEWSYSLLNETDQILFARLSIFVGGFDLEAAEQICVLGKGVLTESILDGIASLINNSLLEQADLLNGRPRFRMLDTIREYALDHLEQSDERPALERKRVHYYTNRMNETYLLFGTQQAEPAFAWVEAEHDNLRAALGWCLQDPESEPQGPFLVSPMVWFWYRRGFLIEGRRWAERILASTSAEDSPEGRGLAVFTVAALALWQGDLHNALASIEKAVQLTQQVENPFGMAITRLFHGTILVNQGKDQQALSILEEARQLYQTLGLRWDHAVSTVHMANAALGLGELERAEAYLFEAQSPSQEVGEGWLQSFVLNNLGELARVRGDFEAAQSYYGESESLLRSMGDKGDLARLIHNLGYIALHQGRLDEASGRFRESLAMFQKLANQRGLAECLAALAALAARRERYPRAAALFAAAENQLAAIGAAWWPADRGQIEHTRELIHDSLDASERAEREQVGAGWDLPTAISFAIGEE
ncbi:MAG: tetratricopeptide repeat protein, partial [Anaerolineae bacterium]|nr:tetratricopeptide repeat protein [Anaerolineae bacterium]